MIEKIFAVFGSLCMTIHRIVNKCERTYQLSKIPHGSNCEIVGKGKFEGNISLGNNVRIGVDSIFLSTEAKIIIKNNVLFGPHVFVISGNHQINQIGKAIIDVQNKTEKCDQDVVIEDDCWIGAGVIILKGVTISRGSVIGAGSIVTKSTIPYSINAGNPSRLIGMRFSENQILEHERILYKN